MSLIKIKAKVHKYPDEFSGVSTRSEKVSFSVVCLVLRLLFQTNTDPIFLDEAGLEPRQFVHLGNSTMHWAPCASSQRSKIAGKPWACHRQFRLTCPKNWHW